MILRDLLIFEDDEAVAEVLSEGLRDEGCQTVRLANRPEDAIAHLQGDLPPEFALVDLWGPSGGGVTVAEAAMSAGIPFCFLTGDHAAADALAMAGIAVVKKPCRVTQIISRAEKEIAHCRAIAEEVRAIRSQEVLVRQRSAETCAINARLREIVAKGMR